MDFNTRNAIVIITIALLIIVIVLCVMMFTNTINTIFNEQTIITETVVARITHLNRTNDAHYYASVTNFNLSEEIEISADQYSSMQIGDTVAVLVETTINTKLPNEINYSIGGVVNVKP